MASLYDGSDITAKDICFVCNYKTQTGIVCTINVIAGWQVTLCDPIWHVSSHSGAVLVAQTAIRFLLSLLPVLPSCVFKW